MFFIINKVYALSESNFEGKCWLVQWCMLESDYKIILSLLFWGKGKYKLDFIKYKKIYDKIMFVRDSFNWNK